MAKSNLTFRRNTTDKLTVKGIMSDDCKTITYTDEYDEEQTDVYKRQYIMFTAQK